MVMTALPRGPVASSEDERLAMAEAEALLRERQGSVVLSDGRGNQAELPETAVQLIERAVQALASGYLVDVAVLPRELTIQQAAELLDLRPQDVVQLIDQGEIPVVQAGDFRRIRFEDVMAYMPKRDADRRAAMNELIRLSEEMGLYEREAAAPELFTFSRHGKTTSRGDPSTS